MRWRSSAVGSFNCWAPRTGFRQHPDRYSRRAPERKRAAHCRDCLKRRNSPYATQSLPRGLQADESQKLARKLKAERLDDRPESIMLKLTEWRTGDLSVTQKARPRTTLWALLEAISKSETGSAGARGSAGRAADDAWAALSDPERLEEQSTASRGRFPAAIDPVSLGTAAFGHAGHCTVRWACCWMYPRAPDSAAMALGELFPKVHSERRNSLVECCRDDAASRREPLRREILPASG